MNSRYLTHFSAKLFLRLDSALFCHSQFHNHPFNRLGPFKVEEMNRVYKVIIRSQGRRGPEDLQLQEI